MIRRETKDRQRVSAGKSPAVILVAALAFLGGACGTRSGPSVNVSDVRTLTGERRDLGEPFGIAYKDGSVIVSDGENGRIMRVSMDGSQEVLTDKLDTPSHIAVDADGSILVADSGTSTIKRVKSDGTIEPVAGTENSPGYRDGEASQAQFRAPIGIAVRDGKIYVADTYNDRIRVIEKGRVSTLAGGERGFADSQDGRRAEFNTPCGLAVLTDGSLLVADLLNHRIRRVEAGGSTSTFAGTGGVEVRDGEPVNASFVSPTDVKVAPRGEIVVADGDALRIIGARFVPIVETVTVVRKGFADGQAGQFNRIGGIAFDGDGEILAADSGNGLVRAFSSKTGKPLSSDAFEKSRSKIFGDSEPPARWPYDPPAATREIAGTFGEVRGEREEEDSDIYFHNGLDIVGGYGETARFVMDEKVLDPAAARNFGTLRELLRLPRLGYIHINLGRRTDGESLGDGRFLLDSKDGELTSVRVPRGTRFRAGEPIGTLNRMNHVHLVVGPDGREVNGLEAISLPGVSDTKPPLIGQAVAETPEGKPFETESAGKRIRLDGEVRLVVDAYDQMDGNADRRRLGVYRLGWFVKDAKGIRLKEAGSEEATLSFDKLPYFALAGRIYAIGSRSGATGPTVFRYIVTNRLSDGRVSEGFFDTSSLAPGDYDITVFAEDYFGNRTEKTIPITISR